jgi:hypothetical protein
MKIMKKALMKPENKKADKLKFKNQYKYLSLNNQKTDRFTAPIDSLNSKLKKLTKRIFYCNKKKSLPPMMFKKFSKIIPSTFLLPYPSHGLK